MYDVYELDPLEERIIEQGEVVISLDEQGRFVTQALSWEYQGENGDGVLTGKTLSELLSEMHEDNEACSYEAHRVDKAMED